MIFCMFVLVLVFIMIYFVYKEYKSKYILKIRIKEGREFVELNKLENKSNISSKSNSTSVNVKGNANNINVKQSTSNVKSTFQGSQVEVVSSINKNNEDLNNLLLSTTLLRSDNNFTICSDKPEKNVRFTSSATDGIGICRDIHNTITDSYRPPMSHDCHSSKSSYTSSDSSSSSSSSGSSYDSSSSSSSSSWD